MRSLGIGALYWADKWTDDQPPFFAKARAAGFDAVEISLINGADFDIERYKEALKRAEISPVCIMGLTPETDISSPDASVREAGIEYVKRALEATAQVGSRYLCGLPYVQWLFFPDDDALQAYRDRCATSLREIAPIAADHDVTMCLEVINRFETFMFNTVAGGLEFLRRVGHPSVKLHLDTYHMNMEEDHIGDAIRVAGGQLGYFHCVESNRKLPGKGLINWTEVREALDDLQYSGGLAIEAFPLPDTETGRTVNTWRPLVDDLEADVREAVRFIREQMIEGRESNRE